MFNVITGFIKMYHRFYISYILKYTFAHVSSNNKYKYVIYMYEFNHKKRANQAGPAGPVCPLITYDKFSTT